METKELKEIKDALQRHDLRFEAIDKRFDSIDRRFESVDDRFSTIDGRFSTIDGRLDVIDGRLFSLEEGFSRLTGTVADMQGEIGDIKENMATKTDIQRILDAVDAHAKRSEEQWQEHRMLVRQVDRHDKWIHAVARKAQVDLDY